MEFLKFFLHSLLSKNAIFSDISARTLESWDGHIMEANSTGTKVLSYSTNFTLDFGGPTCPPYYPTPCITEKFWLVLVVGTTVCLCGIGTNLTLAAILSKSCFKLSHMVYLQVLAGIDICILCAYIAVFSVSIIYDYFNLLFLYIAWVSAVARQGRGTLS